MSPLPARLLASVALGAALALAAPGAALAQPSAGLSAGSPGTPQLPFAPAASLYGFSFRSWGIDEGLPQSTPTQLLFDEDGFLWGGTFAGIFRFDGSDFLAYGVRELPFLESNQATALARASRGGLWVGSASGTLARVYDGVVEESLGRSPAGLQGISGIREGADGTLWVWAGLDLHAYRDGEWSSLGVGESMAWPGVPMLLDGPDGLLIGLRNGLARVRGGRVEAHPPDLPRIDRTVFTLKRDSRGRLWVGTADGLGVAEGTRIQWVPGLSDEIDHVVEGWDGSLWVAGRLGVWVLTGPGLDAALPFTGWDPALLKATRVPFEPGGGGDPQARRVTGLALSPDGVVFAGRLGQGLSGIKPDAVRPVRLGWGAFVDPLRVEVEVHSVVGDGGGGAWISRDCGPALHVSPESILGVRSGTSGPLIWQNDCISSLLVDARGRLWAGGFNFLHRLEVVPGGVSPTRTPSGLTAAQAGVPDPGTGTRAVSVRVDPTIAVESRVTHLVEQRADHVVFALSNGALLIRFPNDSIGPFPGWGKDEIPVTGLAVGGEGELWVGQPGTVTRIASDGAMTRYGTEAGVPEGPVRVLLPEPDGSCWVGSYGGGMALLRDGVAVPVDLQDPTVSAILPDDDGSLWILQNRGVALLPASDLQLIREGQGGGIRPLRLGREVGVPEANNGSPAGAVLPSGLLVLGTLGGLIVLDPDRLPPLFGTPLAHLESVRTPLRTVNLARHPADEMHPTGVRAHSHALELSPDERLAEVTFTAPSFQGLDRVRFRYRVDGRDSDWISARSDRVILLAGLRPGRYTLRLESRTVGGEWRAAEPLSVRVRALWWERTDLRVSALTLLIFLVFLTLRLRLSVREERTKRLEERVRLEGERDELSRRYRQEVAQVERVAMAGELSASLTHEVSQPLSAMVQNAAAIRASLLGSEPDLSDLRAATDDILEQGRRASDVVQGLRRFLRAEGPRLEWIDLARLTRELPEILRHELARAGVVLHIDVKRRPLMVRADRVLLQQVLVNLALNSLEALAESPESPDSLRIRLRSWGVGVQVSVVDRGRGIEADAHALLFEPFYTTRADGMGLGLPIVRRLLIAHGGWVRIRSRAGIGTVVSFWIPREGESQHGR